MSDNNDTRLPARPDNPPLCSKVSQDQSQIATSTFPSPASRFFDWLLSQPESREQPQEQPQPAHQQRHQQQQQQWPSRTSMDPSQALVGTLASGGNSADALTQPTNNITGSGSMTTPQAHGFTGSWMAGMLQEQQQPQQHQPSQQQQPPQQQPPQQQQLRQPPLPPAAIGSNLYQSQYGNTPTASSASGSSGAAVYTDTSSPHFRPGNRLLQQGDTSYSGSLVKGLPGHQSSTHGSNAISMAMLQQQQQQPPPPQ
eukprot:scpid98014/ scgid3334/ 